MKKLMIVQPTNGRFASEVQAERKAAAQDAAGRLGEPLAVLNRAGEPGDYYEIEMEYLAEHLRKMAQADVVYFVRGWTGTHLCRVLHTVAAAYDLLMLYGN